jgi:hypothetical protein
MLRFAASFICETGLQLDASIHDAVLIEAHADEIETAVDQARRAMDQASELVLYGFRLRTDVDLIRWPDRYRDARGAIFFDEMVRKLEKRSTSGGWDEVPYWMVGNTFQAW